MGAMAVVVAGIAVEYPLEMTRVHDDEMVQALGTYCPHEPLGVGIRV
jgi:hypothetical protein